MTWFIRFMGLRSTQSKCHITVPSFLVIFEWYADHRILSLSNRHGTFASLGEDAVISVWDAAAKKRIRQYAKLSSSITAGTFDPSGSMLLVATGSDSVDANEGDGSVTLVLKRNAWEECKPKLKSSSSSASKSSKK